MPKVSVHGGASNAAEETVVEGENGPELVPVTEAPAEDTEGSEESSPGSSSETSSEKGSTSPEQSETPSLSPARKTANRSK
ncbi:hypothetical protein AB0O20_27735 [Streptomyces kronopolitis]|uniref:hypothetical protein n=1 Tax=Streptomyces kronopolitis TaxID=1612435 RepID=UPI00341EFABC